MADRTAHQAAQDVAAAVLGRQDAVGDEEGDGAGVLGDDLKGHLVLALVGSLAAGQLLDGVERGQQQVGRAHVSGTLEDQGEPVQAEPGVDALAGELAQDRIVLLRRSLTADALHEDQVPDLHVALAVHGRAAFFAEGRAAVVVSLGAGSARAGNRHGPVVVFHAEPLDAGGGDADAAPDALGLVVVLVDGDPEPVLFQPVALGQQLPGEGDGFFLEVVTEGEVAHHLEERRVPVGPADVLDVGGAGAFLDAGRTGEVGGGLAEEIGLELVHSGAREKQRGVVGNQRAGRHRVVAAGGEEVGECLADLRRAHGGMTSRGVTEGGGTSHAEPGREQGLRYFSVLQLDADSSRPQGVRRDSRSVAQQWCRRSSGYRMPRLAHHTMRNSGTAPLPPASTGFSHGKAFWPPGQVAGADQESDLTDASFRCRERQRPDLPDTPEYADRRRRRRTGPPRPRGGTAGASIRGGSPPCAGQRAGWRRH